MKKKLLVLVVFNIFDEACNYYLKLMIAYR